MAKHELWELKQMQSLTLRAKVQMTITRIRAWVEEYGEDGVYIAFSGGLDSRVLLHIARSIYPDLQAVFSDTGLEFPEIRRFVKSFDNVEWIKPKISFKEVMQKYGYPFISKEVSECVEGARKYIKILTDRQIDNSVCSILPKTSRNRRIPSQSTNSSTTNFADRASMLQKSRGGVRQQVS